MTERCADLDEFFDGELAAGQADAFRAHLPTCERCQRVLHGRMQESVAVRVPAARLAWVAAPAAPAPAADPALAVPGSAAPPAVAPPAVVPITQQRRGWIRMLPYVAPLLAAAASIPLWLTGDPAFELSVTVDRAHVTDRGDGATAPQRSIAAHTRDVLRPKIHGARHRAIWVYVNDRRLVVACPGAAGCSESGGELALELALTDPGKYAIVGLGSSDPLPAPGTTLDQTRAVARRAGIRTELQYVDVE